MVSIERVIELFREISAIPRGSGNRRGIADYCAAFADSNGLQYRRDEADNVVIYKAANGCEVREPLILQGHLDMVCQKTSESTVDFLRDGIEVVIDGDELKANGTTLGADNGIAVAIVLAVLEDRKLVHPPLEAVLTSDEEIGMVGARALDMSWLSGKRMINLDAEEDNAVTVSCAGGSDLCATLSLTREEMTGTVIEIVLEGLQGGHSGVEIHRGRVNAAVLCGHLLRRIETPYALVSMDSGDKSHAIPCRARITVCTPQAEPFVTEMQAVLADIKQAIAAKEPFFVYRIDVGDKVTAKVLVDVDADTLMTTLVTAPNGVQAMSTSIEGLVETSLNLGVLQTADEAVTLQYALRSNKQEALVQLEERLAEQLRDSGFALRTFGHYPPWEYREQSALREQYSRLYEEQCGQRPQIVAIHAGLECGVFAAAIPDLDCIAIGPALYDVHTVSERLSISSTAALVERLVALCEKLGKDSY